MKCVFQNCAVSTCITVPDGPDLGVSLVKVEVSLSQGIKEVSFVGQRLTKCFLSLFHLKKPGSLKNLPYLMLTNSSVEEQ